MTRTCTARDLPECIAASWIPLHAHTPHVSAPVGIVARTALYHTPGFDSGRPGAYNGGAPDGISEPDPVVQMQVREIDDRREWNRRLLSFPRPHILQSYEWGESKRATGWTPRHLLLEDGGRALVAALVLRRETPLLGAPVLYVPKGPLLAAKGSALLETALEVLEAEARRERAIFIKVDPDIAAEDTAALEVLRRRAWRRGEDVQFRNTILVDLQADEEVLLSRMKPKTRYNIRLAERRGIRVRAGTTDDLPAFYELYRETGRRDGFLTRPYPYYRQIWQTFLESGWGRLFLAEHEGDLLAGLFLLHFGPCAWYMYGASAGRKREYMPNHLLQWEAMRWARSAGCTTYDLWGAPEQLWPEDPLWGVYRFKAGFGGRFASRIGAYDFVVRPALYLAFSWAVPRLLALWRTLQGEPTLGQAVRPFT
ncbi:MAG: lipid II:glycine glycyltransferase FemX [Chloroflexia bacterium]